jgi:quercetin dioxygenase-like cupin family protein
MARVTLQGVPPLDDSELALSLVHVHASDRSLVGDAVRDSLLYVAAGDGWMELADRHRLERDTAALVLAGEEAQLEAAESELVVVRATVGASADRHAPFGPRQAIVSATQAGSDEATGSRSFEVLFGPHNGSIRATLFLGFIPPGKAPWHYHLYDEIVWVPEGPGKLHVDEAVEELGPGAAFRLRPREPHIVENSSPDREMTVVGFFTPAGSPSAAYLLSDAAGTYRIST